MAEAKIKQFEMKHGRQSGWIKVDMVQKEILAKRDDPWPGVPIDGKLLEVYATKAVKLFEDEGAGSEPPPLAAAETSRSASPEAESPPGEPVSAQEPLITASMSDATVTMLAEKGEVRFSFEDFRELDGRVLDKLSRLSLDRYVVELQTFRRRMAREAHEAEYGKSLRIEVMGDNALGRLKVDGLGENWHHYWELPENVYARKKMGYVTVDGRFPEVHAGDRLPGGTRVVHKPDGTPELILMACPKEDAQARIQAQADESAARTGRTKEQLEAAVAQATGKSLPAMMTAKPSEKVRVVKTAE